MPLPARFLPHLTLLTQRRTTTNSSTGALRSATGLAAAALCVVGLAVVAGAPGSSLAAQEVMGQTVSASAPVTLGFATAEDAEARMFLGWINEIRLENEAGPLTLDAELEITATAWTTRLAQADSLSHAEDLALGVRSDWRKLGENVGVAPDGHFEELFEAFVASPTHLANMVDPSFDLVGIGVVHRDGKVWMTQRFMDADPASLGVDLG